MGITCPFQIHWLNSSDIERTNGPNRFGLMIAMRQKGVCHRVALHSLVVVSLLGVFAHQERELSRLRSDWAAPSRLLAPVTVIEHEVPDLATVDKPEEPDEVSWIDFLEAAGCPSEFIQNLRIKGTERFLRNGQTQIGGVHGFLVVRL